MFTGYQYYMDNEAVNSVDYPYTAAKGDCAAENYPGTGVTLKEWRMLSRYDTEEMKKAIASGPIMVGVNANDDFMQYGSGIFDCPVASESDPTGDDPCCRHSTCVNHAVTLIGYGKDESTNDEYWILRNSWSALWGEDGYMRILNDDSDEGVVGINNEAFLPVLSQAATLLFSSSAIAILAATFAF